MEGNGTASAASRRVIEQLLSAELGTHIRIVEVRESPYSRVSRCTLDVADGALPETVIVRVLRDDPVRSGRARLHNEHAALTFLTSIGSTIAPHFVAADPAAGILITDDLGSHPSLLDLLLGNDSGAARQGLLAFAHNLGALHAQTIRHASDYDDLRSLLGPADPYAAHPGLPLSVGESWRDVRIAVAQLGLPDPAEVDRDIDEAASILAAPGGCLALSSGDPSFVNCSVANGTVRFFDFEDAGFRHPLIDASVLRYPYPTGGPVWRLPEDVAGSVERAYREALGDACPGIRDTAVYEQGMAAASAAWTILRMVRLAKVEAGPDRDLWPLLPRGWSAPIPTRSRRRQLVAITETCIAASHRVGAFGALAAWLEVMVSALRVRWPEATEEIPLYPAFR